MPSAKILEAKKAVVEQLSSELKDAKSIIVTESHGLTVEQDTKMRADFRKAGLNYKVVKNTVVSRAALLAGLDGFSEIFKGPTSICYSKDDVVAPAKLTKKYADEFDGFKVKGGTIDGVVSALEEINKLASIPSIETLYTKLVGGLISPIAVLAIYLNQIAAKMEENGMEKVQDAVVSAENTGESEESSTAEDTSDTSSTEAVKPDEGAANESSENAEA